MNWDELLMVRVAVRQGGEETWGALKVDQDDVDVAGGLAVADTEG